MNLKKNLRTFALIMSWNLYYAHKFKCHIMHQCAHWVDVIKWTSIGQILRWQFLITNYLALMILDIRWFPSFFWWIIFSIYFLCLMKKWKSKLSFFAKWTIKFRSFSSLFISVAFSNAYWKVMFWPHFELFTQ